MEEAFKRELAYSLWDLTLGLFIMLFLVLPLAVIAIVLVLLTRR